MFLKTFTISKYVPLTSVSYRFLIFLVAVFSITAEIQNRAIKGIVPSVLQNIFKQLKVDSSNSGLNQVQHRSLEQVTMPSRKLNTLKVIMRHFNPFFSSTTTPHPTAPMSNSAPAPVTVTSPSYATSVSESTTYADSVHLTYSVNTPRTSPLVVIPLRSLVPRSNSLFSI